MHSSEYNIDSNPLTILLAEDDPLLRDLLGSMLRAKGYRLIEAESGDQGLMLLGQQHLDVLVTDISMPGESDGWALAAAARRVHPDIAVVYSSSGPADAARRVSRSLYLRKPYRPDAIVHAVRQLTSRRNDDAPAGS